MHVLRLSGVLCSFAFLTACGANGILGLNPKPDGAIVVSNPSTNAPIVTTLANPYMVSSGAFSIGISENYFTGPYNVTVIAWTAPFNIPCFVPHYIDQTSKMNVVKFSADNAAPLSTPTQASPCNAFTAIGGGTQTDEETVHITDNDGHVATFYYKIQ